MPLDLYISEPTLVTSTGEGLGQLTSPSAGGFKHEDLLVDRKVLKTVSRSASFGLASLNLLKKTQSLPVMANPYRRGLFNAAPSPYTSDKDSYFVPARTASETKNPERNFGKCYEEAAPMTGIMGLPNGSMCFAAQLMQSLGPHGTYVHREGSVHAGLAAGSLHKKLGRIDDFVLFGFAQASEKYAWESLQAYASEFTDFALPKVAITGGFSTYLSGNKEDFVKAPIAKILSCGPTSKLNPAKRHKIVLVSTLSHLAKHQIERQFAGIPIVDYYRVNPYLAEMSGVLEIAHAKTLASAGEIPENSLGIVICADIFGQSSFVEFELLPEYEC